MKQLIVMLCCLAASPILGSEPIAKVVDDFLAKRPTKAIPTDLSLAEARAFQQQYVTRLAETLGEPIGYKVGLVTKETQARYGLNAPVRGVLLKKMLRPNGAEIPAHFGARPLFEADLIVVVGSDRINEARTPEEAAEHLSEFVPFIELADALLDPEITPRGPMLVAANVGARLGVVGSPLKIKAPTEFAKAMEGMTIVMTDESGQELARAEGKVIMGHPLNALLWLVRDLAASGQKLKRGDMVSLGSIAPPQPALPGKKVTVRYEGLPGGELQVSMRFQ